MGLWSNVTSKITAGALTWASKVSGANILTIDPDDGRVQWDKFVGYGAITTPTIATGVLTVTSSCVNPLPESGTADTVDSIVMAGQQAGDRLLCIVPATNTITFDNSATMLLGAATRAVAPGGSIEFLAVSATVWVEINFLAAAS